MIVLGRLALAAAALLAAWLDPPGSAQQAQRLYFFLSCYLAYALLLVPLAWRPPGSLRPLGLITHLADLAAFTILVHLTEGAASPYFLNFMFSLLCATLRWQWRGALWTSVAALAIFVALGITTGYVLTGYVLRDPAFELARFLIRSVYLAVAALMLGYLSAYQGQARRALAVQAGRTSAREERLHLARDLHDGLLQSLAGTGLQLEAARRQVETDAEAAGKGLLEVQRLLVAEQCALRSLIRQLQPDPPAAPRSALGLAAALEELANRIEIQWGLRVELNTDARDGQIPERLAQEACLLVQEALVNVARHADASLAHVRICLQTDGLHMIVADDGRGYPFHGSYDLAALAERGLGPRSIIERITALKGELLLGTSDSGTRLDISLPLGPDAAHPGAGRAPDGGTA